MIALCVRISSPSGWTFADWPVLDGFALCPLATGFMRNVARVLAGALNTSFVVAAVVVIIAFMLLY